ncbi:MAG: hypothetical protein ACNA7I_02010 [Candidatus Methanoperedens sp.]
MTGILDSGKLIELVIEKHNNFLCTFNSEFSELDGKLNSLKKESDGAKQELEKNETKILVLNEKYHLLFHQAKKQREELFSSVIDNMRTTGAPGIHDIKRKGERIDVLENKLQTTKNIEDEDKIIAELTGLLGDIGQAAASAGIAATFGGVVDILDEANASHKEMLAISGIPEKHAGAISELDKQINELEGRCNWLKNRVESHRNALSHWQTQKGGI